jgi:hypothetical protein
MPRVVPSQMRKAIRDLFFHGSNPGPISIPIQEAHRLTATLDLLEEIPTELITLDPADYSLFVSARSVIRNRLRVWESNPHQPQPIDSASLPGGVDPLNLLYRALAKCPDVIPAPGTSELGFIADVDTRESLRLDISEANRALYEHQWKGATVLAGAVVEALLLWALKGRPETAVEGAIQAVGSGLRTRNARDPLPGRLDHQDLSWFITVAAELGVINANTRKAVELAQDFRNLIHPGRVKRVERACDRGTALSAVAALEHVATEFQRRADAGLPI